MNTPVTLDDLANMSDDDLMALPEQVGDGINVATDVPEEDSGAAPADQAAQDAAAAATEVVVETATEDQSNDAGVDTEVLGAADDAFSDSPTKATSPAKAEPAKVEEPAKAAAEVDPKPAAEAAADAAPVDYKAAYEQIFAPFKANGRQVELKSPAEVVALMQMGANYTQKLQALAPQLKLMRMLENQGLLSEDKLTFMIDLNRRDPAAITKLLKDGNIDPLQIDTQAEVKYQPGNHKVSDADMVFVDTLREVNSDPVGAELVRTIDKDWDKPSKEAIWKEPSILKVLHEHRNNGIYDKVLAEVDRRKMFGEFKDKTNLEAYYITAKSLQEQGAFEAAKTTQAPSAAPAKASAEQAPGQGRVVAQRAVVKAPDPDAEKIRAAQPVRAAAQRATPSDFNPLSMSDEEFEKSAHLASRL